MRKQQILNLVFAILILILGVTLFVILSGKFLAAAKAFAQVKREVKERQARIAGLQELQIQYQKIEEQIKSVSSLLPDETNFVKLVEYWEQIASSFNLVLKIQFPKETAPTPSSPTATASESVAEKPKPSSPTSPSSKGKITAVLDASGGVENLFKFWESLEGGRYFIKVLQANLDAPAGRGGEGRLVLKIEVSTDESFPPN